MTTPNTLSSGSYNIISRSQKSLLGVNLTLPAWQPVYLDAPASVWDVERISDGAYRLGVGGYSFTGESAGHVNASIYAKQGQDWTLIWSEHARAYVIENPKDGKGWTASPVSSGDNSQARIRLEPVAATHSIPPQYFPHQLFDFQPAPGPN